MSRVILDIRFGLAVPGGIEDELAVGAAASEADVMQLVVVTQRELAVDLAAAKAVRFCATQVHQLAALDGPCSRPASNQRYPSTDVDTTLRSQRVHDAAALIGSPRVQRTSHVGLCSARAHEGSA